MYKKFLALIMTIVLSTALTVNTFAYSNMYSSNSNIPDFSEFTGATMTGKEYALNGTVYCYTTPITGVESGDMRSVNWFYNYIHELNKNGYIVYDTYFFDSDSGADLIHIHLANPNTGLFVQLSCSEFNCALFISK